MQGSEYSGRQGENLGEGPSSGQDRDGRIEPIVDRTIGVLGGTFDPIHFGHLRTGLELLERLSLSEVRFIPCRQPPHRDAPATPAALRLRMVKAAIAEQRGFVADGRELERNGPSYTVDTLIDLRDEHPSAALCLLLGMDAFLGLQTWDRWQQLFELAHIVVAHRPGWPVPKVGPLGNLIRDRRTETALDLSRTRAGRIHVEVVTQLEISATELRNGIRAGESPRYLVPDSVRHIILETECYAEKHTEESAG